jgi:uncharacterized protein (TIGR00251 family)
VGAWFRFFSYWVLSSRMTQAPLPIEAMSQPGPGVRLRVKVVPGASRTRIVGVLGDHLKIQVAAPPQAGQANQAVCQLLAEVLGVPLRQVTVIAGAAQPRKTIAITGLTAPQAAARLRPAFPQP